MKQHILKLAEKIDALTLRERGVVMAAVLAVVIMAWDSILMEPLNQEEKIFKLELKSLDTRVSAITVESESLIKLGSFNPNLKAIVRIQDLEKRIQKLDSKIKGLATNVVTPTQMAQLLDEMLAQQANLDLVRLESIDSEPLVKNGRTKQPAEMDDTKAVESKGLIYKHGMIIQVVGSYMDLLTFLQTVEGFEWGVLWDSVVINQRGYPRNNITVRLHTISLDKSWIGV